MQVKVMWKALWKTFWKTWTIDRPAAFGDLLWEVLVVQFAALLDRLTVRKVIALVPIVVIAVAYHHGVPLPPELMLVGDLLAYIDVVTVILLVGLLSRATTILFVIRQAAARVAQIAGGLITLMRRLDVRHRRERTSRGRKWLSGPRGNDDREGVAVGRLAWA
jgi:hypothetical protein